LFEIFAFVFKLSDFGEKTTLTTGKMADQANPPAYTLPVAPAPGPGIHQYSGQAGQTQPYHGQAGLVQPVVAIQSGQPVQMYAYNSPPVVYGNYNSKQSMGLGVTQVVVGVICIVINAIGIAFGSLLAVVSIGIWGGIMFIISGSFGISAAKWRTKCKVIAFMVLCIISAAITVPLFICAVMGAALDGYYENCYSLYYNYYRRSYNCQEISHVAVAMNAVLASLAIVQAIAAIWGSAICCKAACCCKYNNSQVVAPIQFATIQGQQVIIIPQSQLNLGGQMMTYAPPDYSTQQVLSASGPPYQISYGQNPVASFVPQTYHGNVDNLEKQHL